MKQDRVPVGMARGVMYTYRREHPSPSRNRVTNGAIPLCEGEIL